MSHPNESVPTTKEGALRQALASELSQATMAKLDQVLERTGLDIREILAQAIDAAWNIEFDEELTRHLTLLDEES